MALIAWLPENVIWGKPKIIDVLVVSGKSVAEARDAHYHRPPDYLVFEPEDTSNRTSNLQQTNTNGYKLQTDKCDVKSAIEFVEKWGESALEYSPTPEYQQRLRSLYGQFVYRLDADEAVLEEDKGKMTVRFWKPVMKKGGIVEFIRPEECTQKRHIREMERKIFGKDNFTGLKEFTSEEVGE